MPTKEEIEKLKKENPKMTFREIGIVFKISHVRVQQILRIQYTPEYKMRRSHYNGHSFRENCFLCLKEPSLVRPLQASTYTI